MQKNKAQFLNKTFGKQQFIYAGNSKDDLKVWPHALFGLAVNAPKPVLKQALALQNILKIFSSHEFGDLPKQGEFSGTRVAQRDRKTDQS